MWDAIKNNKLYIYLSSLILLILISNCSSKTSFEEEKEIYAILSKLISENTGSKTTMIPPPLLEDLNDTTTLLAKKRDSFLKMIRTDSFKNKKFVIAIVPYLFSISENIKIDSLYQKDFSPLAEKLISLKENRPIKIEKIKPTRGNTLINAPEIERLKEDEIWDNFNEIFNCSRISFNSNYTKAIAVIGISKSKHDGYSTLILLEKVDDEWRIKYNKLLTVS